MKYLISNDEEDVEFDFGSLSAKKREEIKITPIKEESTELKRVTCPYCYDNFLEDVIEEYKNSHCKKNPKNLERY